MHNADSSNGSMFDGHWLQTERIARGMRQQDIANLILPVPINPGRVSEIETGRRLMRDEWRQQWQDYFQRSRPI